MHNVSIVLVNDRPYFDARLTPPAGVQSSDEDGDEQPRKERRPFPTQNHSASVPSGMDEEVT